MMVFTEIRPPPSVVSDDEEDEFRQSRGRRKLTVPTVFRWEYGGKEVYLSGSFNEWKTRIPMAYRYVLELLPDVAKAELLDDLAK